jgi:hypothetical protein
LLIGRKKFWIKRHQQHLLRIQLWRHKEIG